MKDRLRLRLPRAGTIEPADAPWSALLPTPAEMAELDRKTIEGGVAAEELMERAGAALARQIASLLREEISKTRILLLCGPGNNGGDGRIVARLLRAHSPEPLSVEVIEPKTGVPEDLRGRIRAADLVIDALLGTGQRRAPEGPIARAIEALNAVRGDPDAPVVIAVDLPSGVDAESGACFTPHVRADLTLTIELVKRGLTQYPAREACGAIRALGIGISGSGIGYRLLSSASTPRAPERGANSHKGTFGRVIVVGGSKNMPGAPFLSARAALRSGSGLVTVVRGEGFPSVDSWPELMLREVPAPNGAFAAESATLLRDLLERADVLVVGPGLGDHPGTSAFLRSMLEEADGLELPAVIDADGLNFLAERVRSGEKLSLNRSVLTPHAAELGRFFGVGAAEVQSNRFEYAERLSAETGATVVLKGAATIVRTGDSGAVCSTGGPELATPGSGDVLAGLIGSLVGQGMEPAAAAELGAYAHGRAGNLALAAHGRSIIASDIVDAIPKALAERC